MMKVHVQLYSRLSDLAGIETVYLDAEEGARISHLLERLYEKLPTLRAHDKNILVGAGLEFVDREYKLKPGDEISIMPPVQGG